MYKIITIVLIFSFLGAFAQTEGELTVNLTTEKTGGKYAPRNVMAIWVENSAGDFVKTLLAYGDKRRTHLNNWQEVTTNASSEYNVTDAITGATNSSHDKRSCTWDGIDFNGAIAPDGEYKLCFELTDKNETGNYSVFDINKSTDEYTLNPNDEPSFTSIQINWLPSQTTGINKITNAINVYPNPTTGIVSIHGNNINHVEFTDINGKIILKGNKQSYNLSAFANGNYIVNVYTKDGVITKKIVKN